MGWSAEATNELVSASRTVNDCGPNAIANALFQCWYSSLTWTDGSKRPRADFWRARCASTWALAPASCGFESRASCTASSTVSL